VGKSKVIKGNQINWNQVFYFSEVAAHGSLKEASQRLGLSSSTLSEHISQLEGDLKVQLFHRLPRKLSLTPEGTKLFQYAKQMFETGQRLIDVVSPISLGCYPISVGLVPSLSLPMAYRLIDKYLSSSDRVSMKFLHAKHEELEKGLSEARFDFGFSNQPPERKDIVSQLLSTTSLGFYVAFELSKKKFLDLLEEIPILICKSDLRVRGSLEEFLDELDIVPNGVISSDYPSLIVDLCRQGKGIGVFAEASMEIQSSDLSEIKAPKGAPRLNEKLFALWPKGGENSESVRYLKAIL
jgi:LysR family transcriptional activator of nhaA